jgi:hypothetical protein
MARRHLERRRSSESIESADLANEAYLKLERAVSKGMGWLNDGQGE